MYNKTSQVIERFFVVWLFDMSAWADYSNYYKIQDKSQKSQGFDPFYVRQISSYRCKLSFDGCQLSFDGCSLSFDECQLSFDGR